MMNTPIVMWLLRLLVLLLLLLLLLLLSTAYNAILHHVRVWFQM